MQETRTKRNNQGRISLIIKKKKKGDKPSLQKLFQNWEGDLLTSSLGSF